MLVSLKPIIYPSYSRSLSSLSDINNIIFRQLSRTSSFSLKGFSAIVTSIFGMIIFINILGIVPYIFSLSRHLIITLTIGLPMWLSLIISRFSKNPKAATAHFLPDGAPDWLNPFLVIIESTRILVRPLTLSFRLAANMTAGHIVLSLVGIYSATSLLTTPISATLFILFRSFYILFELAICLIQAYIFCLLVSLYSDDHA